VQAPGSKKRTGRVGSALGAQPIRSTPASQCGGRYRGRSASQRALRAPWRREQIEPLPLVRPPARPQKRRSGCRVRPGGLQDAHRPGQCRAAEGLDRSAKAIDAVLATQGGIACNALPPGVTRPGSAAGLESPGGHEAQPPRFQPGTKTSSRNRSALRTISSVLPAIGAQQPGPASKPQPAHPFDYWGRRLTKSAAVSIAAAQPIMLTCAPTGRPSPVLRPR